MSRLSRSLVAAGFLAAALPAAAYLRETTVPGRPNLGTCLWWGGRQVTYKINTAGLAQTSCPASADAEMAVTTALSQWGAATHPGGSSPCTDFSFEPASVLTTSQTAIGRDGVNLLVFRQGECAGGQTPTANNCWSHGVGTIALTTTSFDSDTGQIFDADVEFNSWDGTNTKNTTHGFNFSCATPSDGPCSPGQTGCNDTDIIAVATHESGHMFGLDHVCTTEFGPGFPKQSFCFSGQPPIMSPTVGSVFARTLQADDVDGVCAIYPTGAATLTCPAVAHKSSGGCASAGGAGIAGLVGLVALLRRRRR